MRALIGISAAVLLALHAGRAFADEEKPSPQVAALIESLRNKDEGERLKAAKELAKLGPAAKSAAPVLAELAAKDPDEDVRRVAGQALEKVKAQDTAAQVASLTAELKDKDVAVRFRAVKKLAELGAAAKSALPALAELADKDPDEDVRRVAGQAREKIQPAAARNDEQAAALVKGLRDADLGIRFKSAKELGRLGAAARSAVPALTEALKDSDEDVRLAAKAALEKIEAGVKAAGVQEQIALLRDKDIATRLAAAKDLEAMGPAAKDAVPALTEALKDADDDVRRVAARAIAAITRQGAPAGTTKGEPAPVKTLFDTGQVFRPATIEQAAALINEIEKASHLRVHVETFAALPAGVRTADDLLAVRTKALNLEGLLIVLVKNPGSLRTQVGQKSQPVFGIADRDEMGRLMLAKLKAGDWDGALLDGLRFVKSRAAQGGKPAGP